MRGYSGRTRETINRELPGLSSGVAGSDCAFAELLSPTGCCPLATRVNTNVIAQTLSRKMCMDTSPVTVFFGWLRLFFSMASDPQEPEKKNSWVQMANYAQLAVIFPAATVVGWLIGVALDRWLHTTWLYIVGLLLGIVAGFVELIRTATKNTS